MDTQLLQGQQWFNKVFANTANVPPIQETGTPSWNGMYSLTRALQTELGVTTPSNTFGPETLNRLQAQYGTVSSATTSSKIIGILQVALWSKGYQGSAYGTDINRFGTWVPETSGGVTAILSDMGLGARTSVPPKAFKSILTMDAYKRVGRGTDQGTAVQRWMNGRYLARSDYYIVPCDGAFSRDVQRGIMLAIQYEIGMADGVANGNFGPATQQGLKDYGLFGSGQTESSKKLISLFQAALIFNNYSTSFSGTFDSSTVSSCGSFQSFVGLPVTSTSNYSTWASLLVSTGDVSRSATGADTATPLNLDRAQAIFGTGVRTVGRYLNGTTKRIVAGEPETLINLGFGIVPIYQEFNNSAPDFSYDKGLAQGRSAVLRLRQMGFPNGSRAFLAVDYDATDPEISTFISDHFRGVRDGFAATLSFQYKFGVYGTRNVGASLTAAGLVDATFVSDLSTGYSGNLGFPLPSNWHLDQIQTKTVGSGAGQVEIDRDVVSSRAQPVKTGLIRVPRDYSTSPASFDESTHWRWAQLMYLAEQSSTSSVWLSQYILNDLVLNWVQKPTYWTDGLVGTAFTAFTPLIESRPFTNMPQEQYNAVNQTRQRFESSVTTASLPADGAFGDTRHFAATARSYTAYTVPSPADTSIKTAEYGGWALDLVTAWTEYEKFRIASAQNYNYPVKDWMLVNVGKTSAEFSRADLLADAAGALVGSLIAADTSRPLDDIIRELLVGAETDSNYLVRRWFQQRFDSRTDLASRVAQSLWTIPFPANAPVLVFQKGVRQPGELKSDYPNPPSSALSTEIADIGSAFAQVLLSSS